MLLNFSALAQSNSSPFIPIHCEGDLETEARNLMSNYLKEKRIIAFGEATHGTHEFFKMKHTFVKYLVKEHGFRLFGMETHFSAYLLNDYINRKDNDLAKVLKNIYLIYGTQEVVDLINWMREYNDSVEEDKKIIFYGIDSQHIGYLMPELINYIKKVDPEYTIELESRLKYFQGKLKFHRRLVYLKNLKKIERHIETRREQYIKLSSTKEYKIALKLTHNLKDAVKTSAVINKYSGKSLSIRDEAMAENVNWLLDYEGAESKIILWAHNAHIQKTKFNGKKKDPYHMGMELKKRFGDRYYAVGFEFDKGSFHAVNFTNGAKFEACTVTNEDSSSFAALFKEITYPCFFIDFASLQNTEYYKKLENVTSIRCVGVDFSGEKFSFKKLDVKNAFDALIFIKNTSPSKILFDANKSKRSD